MDMDIDESILSSFKAIGMIDQNDFLKMHNISKETGISAAVLAVEWDIYANEKKLNDPQSFCEHIGKFRTVVKKKATQLKKSSASAAAAQPAASKSSAKSATATTATTKSTTAATTTVSSTTKPTAASVVSQTKTTNDFEFDFGDDNNDTSNNNNDVDLSDFDLKGIPSLLPVKKSVINFNYAARKESSKIVSTYNKELVIDMRSMAPSINLRVIDDIQQSLNSMKYMSDTIVNRSNQLVLDSTQSLKSMVFVDTDGKELIDSKPTATTTTTTATSTSSNSLETVRIAGRVWPCDNGLLSNRFQLLGHTQKGIDSFKFQKETALFSGQLVTVEGENIPGSNFGCSSVYYPKQLDFYKSESLENQEKSVHIMFASGPFSLHHCFDYTPLDDFLKLVEKNQANLVILFGPFIDEGHDMAQFQNDESLLDTLFAKLGALSATQFIVVPSIHDINSEYIFPQPPLPSSRKYNNVQFVSNPSTLLVNNSFTIGLNNTDIVGDIQRKTSRFNLNNKDICKMIIQQQNYYPLHPSEIPIEMANWNLMKFPGFTPNLMLFGSKTHFTENVNDVLCISSGSLVRFNTFSDEQNVIEQSYNNNAPDECLIMISIILS
ncbi:hypothetical protein PPL_09091 [Heterostelium album PN500]|uniref:DNA polymerase alpha subunit B n=1 Tax=Heterostelium pallidum (strain ATCC 26659 / Pp 5 / PN500) TaxID=670386 RepID=D3BKK9_HETP5|nr:hypothetical protein PPL_09091 [Heterostelium album PN500]EFA78439.1 hypothetical protein PPL_09091 [Heterostelium album PN500]|eukprot:XP_020430564.1 hypothetical protein PPL_09091 [Heterostelium album PN500]